MSYFKIIETAAGHHTVLYGDNHEPVMTSEVLTSKAHAVNVLAVAAQAFGADVSMLTHTVETFDMRDETP